MNPISDLKDDVSPQPEMKKRSLSLPLFVLGLVKILRWKRQRKIREQGLERRLMQTFSTLEDKPIITTFNLPRFRESEEGSSFWCGGVLAPDDKIYYIPGGELLDQLSNELISNYNFIYVISRFASSSF